MTDPPAVQRAAQIAPDHFAAPICRNCGAALSTPYCGSCGQKKALRLDGRALRRETWAQWRLFELIAPRTLWHLVTGPGRVAREYVLGERKRHMHPLKLLVLLVALLVLLLNANQLFSHHGYSSRADDQVTRMAALVQGYANWSFSLSIVAIFAASSLVFRRRLGYNALEHAVLAVYCQIVIIAAQLLSLSPTLVWTSPDFIAHYKALSGRWMYVVKLLVVGAGFHQFFVLEMRRDWPRLLLSLALYAGISWLLLRAFALAILRIVQYQLS